MTLSEYLKPALVVAFVAVLGVGWYWFERRPHPEEKETPSNALVIVTKSTNACFSDLVRVTGFVVPRREAVVGADQEGSKVTDLFVREGEMVSDNQELARLTPPPAQPGAPNRSTAPVSLRAPAAGLVAGRADVPDFRQQRNRTGCRGAEHPHAQTQSGCDGAHKPGQCA